MFRLQQPVGWGDWVRVAAAAFADDLISLRAHAITFCAEPFDRSLVGHFLVPQGFDD
jgi:hypothetical protein